MGEPTRPSIAVTPRGPYVVSGLTNLRSAGGEPMSTEPEMALCRCGYSKNKPFCDGGHGPYQFGGHPTTDVTAGEPKAYAGAVTVRYNPAICAHLGVCTGRLPEVFDVSRRPWILPDGADAARVLETVRTCPSGALTASFGAEADAASSTDPTAGEPAIRVLKDGPLAVTGDVNLKGVQWADGAARDRYTLCRCGASRAMPFCDASHAAVKFTDPA